MNVLLLGIGNILYADEGVGVHFVNYIQANYKITHDTNKLTIIDGGTLAQTLIPEIAKYDHLIIVDTVNAINAKLGAVYFFNFEQTPPEIDWQGSAHEVEMLQTLTMMDLVGDRPETHILGIVPTIIEPMSFSLTETIVQSIPLMVNTLLNHLIKLEFTVEKNNNIPINIVIADCYKRPIIGANA